MLSEMSFEFRKLLVLCLMICEYYEFSDHCYDPSDVDSMMLTMNVDVDDRLSLTVEKMW